MPCQKQDYWPLYSVLYSTFQAILSTLTLYLILFQEITLLYLFSCIYIKIKIYIIKNI